jgi:hypothetical protein
LELDGCTRFARRVFGAYSRGRAGDALAN